METKDNIRVLFDTDADGYIIGYQQEFYDGKEWQTPFDTTNAVEVAPDDLDTIVIGATKLIDGQLVLDTSKQAELEAEAN
ncbi:phage infection protein, partial [Lacticaseibacillus paracasei]|uniref:phage infection protein n=1 Tax=Lacticaseibacillus paracasei TaxID=1597 RepID=UPI0021A49B3F